TQLRELSDSTAQLIMKDVSSEHVAARATRMLALSRAVDEVDTATDVADVILGLGLDVVDATCGVIGRNEQGQWRGIRASGYDAPTATHVLNASLDDPSPLSASVRLGQPIYLASVQEYRTQFPGDYDRVGVASRACAHAALPLIYRGALVGGLALTFAEPTAFSESEQALLSLLAHTAAWALARVSRFDAEGASQGDDDTLSARWRGEVLGVVAHDLRNPLNLIRISTEMMLEHGLPAATREQMLKRCIRATEQMNRLIEDLLDATHIETAGLRLDLAPIDVRELMAQVNEAYRPLAQERRVAWEVSGAEAPLSVRMDASRVLQAVGNLVGNALKFTPPGGRVAVWASATPHEVVIEVSDTGPGISPEQIDRVFEPFWQAATDRRGVGLGLTIARGIAEAHQGRIDIESALGKGSTFRLILPLASAVTQAA
ncbi:MAG TPA: GAF domain-containing sensor histidine kinase, partial [Gemmatimonadaceae bacterium]|nr:GAF domain-containing sensor histidine kinase [Gemmatimonadaceae bacterium]